MCTYVRTYNGLSSKVCNYAVCICELANLYWNAAGHHSSEERQQEKERQKIQPLTLKPKDFFPNPTWLGPWVLLLLLLLTADCEGGWMCVGCTDREAMQILHVRYTVWHIHRPPGIHVATACHTATQLTVCNSGWCFSTPTYIHTYTPSPHLHTWVCTYIHT